LCRRFAIDLSLRDKHGAEIDCSLLAAVYVELLGGKQPGLDFAVSKFGEGADMIGAAPSHPPRPARPHAPSADELAAHQAMLAAIKAPLWLAAAEPAGDQAAAPPTGWPPGGLAAALRRNRSPKSID